MKLGFKGLFSRSGLLLSLTLLLCGTLAAQGRRGDRLDPVSVGIAFESTSYIVGEPIPAKVLVRNNTPMTITLGEDDRPAATVHVYRGSDSSKTNLATDKRGVLPTPLVLKPNEQKIFTIDMTKCAAMMDEGHYNVIFGAIYQGYRYNTTLYGIDIVPGYIIAEGTQLFANDKTRQRNFKLVRWPRKHIDCLFLRVRDEPDGQWFPTLNLGAYLPLGEPRMNIAASGEVTFLHRATPEYYVRHVFWSLPKDFILRSRLDLLDPATADTARLNGLRGDLDTIIKKNEKQKEND